MTGKETKNFVDRNVSVVVVVEAYNSFGFFIASEVFENSVGVLWSIGCYCSSGICNYHDFVWKCQDSVCDFLMKRSLSEVVRFSVFWKSFNWLVKITKRSSNFLDICSRRLSIASWLVLHFFSATTSVSVIEVPLSLNASIICFTQFTDW